jgi:hypothetical protein
METDTQEGIYIMIIKEDGKCYKRRWPLENIDQCLKSINKHLEEYVRL